MSQGTRIAIFALLSISLISILAPFEAQSQTETASNSSPPTVTSIERSSPAQQDTDSQSLVFEVTFSEPVTGVDPADFALSGNHTVSAERFTRTSEPALAMPDNGPAVSDTIMVGSVGTAAAASVSVDVDITHKLINELQVSLMAPDGTVRTLHDQTGGARSDLRKTYAPDFGSIEMNGEWRLLVADTVPYESGVLNSWTLTINHASSGDAASGVAGSGAQYFVTVPAVRDGTYNLDIVPNSGIADADGEQLGDTTLPTESDQSYVVQTGPPIVASIERSSPAQQDTDRRSLVFGVNFSESVTGVGLEDFALSVDGDMATRQFTHASTPALAIPDDGPPAYDAVTVDTPGTVTSVSVDVDITHPYAGDIRVDLISPDGAVVTLHDYGGAGTADINETYAPDFGNIRMDGDWTLRVGDIWDADAGTLNGWNLTINHVDAPVAVTGSDAQYLVTVVATQTGTYNLDIVANSGIADIAGNPLASPVPVGQDHSYAVSLPELVDVTAVPIVIESTTADYFVLYVRHDLNATATVNVPVSVTLGENYTTALAENVEALPKERYLVEKYSVADPADVDGDGIDDITELENPASMNPLNPAASINIRDGTVAALDMNNFKRLADKYSDNSYLKFVILGMYTDNPSIYFMNTKNHLIHTWFLDALGIEYNPDEWLDGDLYYYPNLAAPDGSLGAYFVPLEYPEPFSVMARIYTILAANMPLLDDNLVYYMPYSILPASQPELPSYRDSRIDLVFDEDIFPETEFLALNRGEGYGLLRIMESDERPNPRDVVAYGTLPNDLPRVAGIISAVPQTPLSHVNLRAVQDDVPNAFVKDALDKSSITSLAGQYVRYAVTDDGYTIRAATLAEVNAHYESSRPAREQTPQRDLSVTSITPLSEIGFGDWTAFGVKAANVARAGNAGLSGGDGARRVRGAVLFLRRVHETQRTLRSRRHHAGQRHVPNGL